jgi:hypothetical protein
VPEGALVIFTGLRGHPVRYELRRLGYETTDGKCDKPATQRNFSCRNYPREMDSIASPADIERVASDPTLIRADVDDYIASARKPLPAMYLVFGSFGSVGGGLSVGTADLPLVESLPALRFKPVSVDPRLGIVEYRPM